MQFVNLITNIKSKIVEKNELLVELEGLKSTLETSINEKTKSEIAEQLKSAIAAVDAKIDAINTNDNADALKSMVEEVSALKAEQTALLKGFDLLQTRVKNNSNKVENKKFADLFAESLKENFDAIQSVKKGSPFKLELKAGGNMLLSTSLDGDGQATYSSRQGILPSQKINFRDLIPTSVSPTGLYVQYQEGAPTGTALVQVEGDAKSQIQYNFTEIKVVEDYIAGFARFSKQMAKQLPYMQSTLPRLLTRDFYKAENQEFYKVVKDNATGVNTSAETDPVKRLIDLIGNQNSANFNASYALVNPATLAALNKNLYTNGFYQGSGGVVSLPSGAIVVAGTPVVAASWVEVDKVVIFDMDYLERVETESLNVEFAMEDADNFTKNLVTARIECQEAINLMLPQSAIYGVLVD